MELTAEIMDQEAAEVAKGFLEIGIAGTTKGLSIPGKVAVLLGKGLPLFGDIESGLDDDANRLRFLIKVLGKATDEAASRLIPLTEPSDK